MRLTPFCLCPLLALLWSTGPSFALRHELIGPVDPGRFHAQPGWPAGLVEILRHKSRVSSFWVNGHEDFFFKATPDEITELINAFSATRLREHLVIIKKGTVEANTLKKGKIDYNGRLEMIDGIVLHHHRSKGEAKTFEPVLTIKVGPADDLTLLKQIPLPENIILQSSIPAWPNGKMELEKRKLWHARSRWPR